MKCVYKRLAAAALALVLAAGSAAAQIFADAQVFRLDVKKDAVICGAELAGEIYHTLYDHFVTDDDWDGESFDKNDVNPLDRALMHSYSRSLDTAGDMLVFATAAVTFMTAETALWIDEGYGTGDLLTAAFMYAETMAISHTVAHITKGLVLRTRPYNYYEGDEATEDDWNRSFYSGHTTMAFAAATFTSYTFWNYFPESKWKIPVAAGSYGLAAATGVIRVRAGCHFATDVLVGALAGTAIGFLVPWCHKVSTERMQLSLAPTGAAVRFVL